MNGNQIVNVYDAAGRKLRTASYTQVEALATPATQVLQLEYTLGKVTETTITYNGNQQTTITFPHDDSITLPRTTYIYNAEGYVTKFTVATKENPSYAYHYYRRDHLGNHVAVWDATDDITKQRTFFYATGMPMSCSMGQSSNRYTYNGKEYVEDHGLDVYDYGFRGYYATIGRFTSIDPLAEQTPWQSPYVYANNNFICNVDYMGLSSMGYQRKYNYVAINNGIVVGFDLTSPDHHIYDVDEEWDGTYEGLSGYEQIGWQIPGWTNYIIGQPCYYLGSVAQVSYSKSGYTVTGSIALMYGKERVIQTIDNTFEAVWHYFTGDGFSIALGDHLTKRRLLTHPEFCTQRNEILTKKIRGEGIFTINMAAYIFHIGRTTVSYYAEDGYSIFSLGINDGFWDPNYIAEHVFRREGDRKGPALEFIGTPYDYIPLVILLRNNK